MATFDADASPRERLEALLQVPPIEQVHENVRRMWHMGERFPVPKFIPSCPCCSSVDVILRYFRFFKRGGHATYPFRCDVHMKCATCSVVWAYGVVIPEEMFIRNQKYGMVHRKIILQRLESKEGV